MHPLTSWLPGSSSSFLGYSKRHAQQIHAWTKPTAEWSSITRISVASVAVQQKFLLTPALPHPTDPWWLCGEMYKFVAYNVSPGFQTNGHFNSQKFSKNVSHISLTIYDDVERGDLFTYVRYYKQWMLYRIFLTRTTRLFFFLNKWISSHEMWCIRLPYDEEIFVQSTSSNQISLYWIQCWYCFPIGTHVTRWFSFLWRPMWVSRGRILKTRPLIRIPE